MRGPFLNELDEAAGRDSSRAQSLHTYLGSYRLPSLATSKQAADNFMSDAGSTLRVDLIKKSSRHSSRR